MKYHFVTIGQYANRHIEVGEDKNPIYKIFEDPWKEYEIENIKMRKLWSELEDIINKRQDKVVSIQKLNHDDIGNIGNRLFKIQGEKQEYVLKALGDNEQNQRELMAWDLLNYNTLSGERTKEKIKGLPTFIYTSKTTGFILMPYYKGVLKPIIGGGYEFPLILSLIISLTKTLEKIHNKGLMYMDLCPDNIMYEIQDNNNTISFFLTDMGGVRPLCDNCLLEWKDLNQKTNMCYKRWTREEVKPPEDIFPNKQGCPSEINENYDIYTLIKTSTILSGFGIQLDQSLEAKFDEIKKQYPEDFILENPLNPTKQEVEKFYELIEPVTQGKNFKIEDFQTFFEKFFIDRMRFIRRYLQDNDIGKKWKYFLLQRFNLYNSFLTQEEKNETYETIKKESEIKKSNQILSKHIHLMNSIPQYILKGDFDNVEKSLKEFSKSRLISISKIAKYSYLFHRKIFRMLNNGKTNSPFIDSVMQYYIPEKKTIALLRQNRSIELNLLTRTIAFE